MKKLKNNSGFTLVEVMIAAGMVGVISLIAFSSLRNSNQTINIAKVTSESSYLKNLVLANMSNPVACRNTFLGSTIVNPTVSLRDKGNNVFLNAGRIITEEGPKGTGTQAQTLFTITRVASGDVTGSNKTLRIFVDYTIRDTLDKVSKAATKKSFEVDVFVVKTGANITNCFVDTGRMLKIAVENSCVGNGAIWNATTLTCTHTVRVNGADVAAGIPASGTCPAGQFMKSVTNAGGITNFTCATYNTKNPPCAAGYYLKDIDSDGAPVCVQFSGLFLTNGGVINSSGTGYDSTNMDCPADQVLRRLIPKLCGPKVITKTCPVNQYISDVDAAGNVTCKSYQKAASACPAGQYLIALNSDGSIPAGGCGAAVIPATCGAGYSLSEVNSAGNAVRCHRDFND